MTALSLSIVTSISPRAQSSVSSAACFSTPSPSPRRFPAERSTPGSPLVTIGHQRQLPSWVPAAAAAPWSPQMHAIGRSQQSALFAPDSSSFPRQVSTSSNVSETGANRVGAQTSSYLICPCWLTTSQSVNCEQRGRRLQPESGGRLHPSQCWVATWENYNLRHFESLINLISGISITASLWHSPPRIVLLNIQSRTGVSANVSNKVRLLQSEARAIGADADFKNRKNRDIRFHCLISSSFNLCMILFVWVCLFSYIPVFE
jgi:hypothetical protein